MAKKTASQSMPMRMDSTKMPMSMMKNTKMPMSMMDARESKASSKAKKSARKQ